MMEYYLAVQFSSVQLLSHVRLFETLWLQHARPPCPSSTPGVHSNSRPSSQWCHPAISSSVIPFSSCPQSLPASESFPMSQIFAWGGRSIAFQRANQPSNINENINTFTSINSVQFICSVMSDSLRPNGLKPARPPCPSSTPGAYSNSCPLSQWYHPTISSSVIPFSSCLQSFPASGSFPMNQFFAWGGQSIGVSAQHQSFQWISRTDFH